MEGSTSVLLSSLPQNPLSIFSEALLDYEKKVVAFLFERTLVLWGFFDV